MHVQLGNLCESTAKIQKHVAEIRRFLEWCEHKAVAVNYPFSPAIVTLYLFELLTRLRNPPSVLVLAHAALKWFHSFAPLGGPNRLDDPCCKNIIESARRERETSIQKEEPISAEPIKRIIDRFSLDGASIKDLRNVALCSLGYADFFRFNELSNMTDVIT